jgi:hypothetical protein
MKTTFILFLLAVLSLDLRAQAPGVVTYQGRITNAGAPFTGTGQFRFVIYRNGPPTALWSHDNSSVNRCRFPRRFSPLARCGCVSGSATERARPP